MVTGAKKQATMENRKGLFLKKTVVLLFLTFVAGVIFADPVEGYWLSVDDKTGKITAGWHVYQEGGKLFGRLLSLADYPNDVKAEPCKDTYPGFPVAGKVNQMTVAGTPWIFGLSQVKTGEWGGGNIIDPESGRMYQCKIIFRTEDGKKYKTDVLEMRGHIGVFGRSQYWTKTDRETAGGLKSGNL